VCVCVCVCVCVIEQIVLTYLNMHVNLYVYLYMQGKRTKARHKYTYQSTWIFRYVRTIYFLRHTHTHTHMRVRENAQKHATNSRSSAGWQRCIGCLKLQVSFRKWATNYRAFWREMTYKDKASKIRHPMHSRHPVVACGDGWCVCVCACLYVCVYVCVFECMRVCARV